MYVVGRVFMGLEPGGGEVLFDVIRHLLRVLCGSYSAGMEDAVGVGLCVLGVG